MPSRPYRPMTWGIQKQRCNAVTQYLDFSTVGLGPISYNVICL